MTALIITGCGVAVLAVFAACLDRAGRRWDGTS